MVEFIIVPRKVALVSVYSKIQSVELPPTVFIHVQLDTNERWKS